MLRSLIVPGVLIGLISIPFVIPTNQKKQTSQPEQTVSQPNPFQFASTTQSAYGGPVATGQLPVNAVQTPVYDERGQLIGYAPQAPIINASGAISTPLEGVPDVGSAQTYFLPGTAHGPDLTADPIDFVMPVNLADIFNFDVTPESIRTRWDRVSTTPLFDGLSGFRVALVTGTNSWDVHGSLTYYFDEYQKCRRITFRGWAGDSGKLIQLLQNHQFKKQPSRNAGFYLAKSRRRLKGGLLMKNPTVMYRDNRLQQVAIVLEMNQPASNHELSQDFISLVRGSNGE